MALWNSGAVWNRKGNEAGFTWNSSKFLFIVRISDTLKTVDNISEILARMILAEKPIEFYEALVNTAFYGKVMEEFTMQDENPAVSLLFALADNIGMKDEFTDFIVKMFLEDKTNVLDDIKLLVELLESDDFNLNEITSVQAFLDMLEKYNLNDLKAESLVELFLHDRFGLIDRDPKEAVSDFMIGHGDNVDTAYDYFLPLSDMRIDWGSTSIAHVPKANITEITMPSVDGSMTADVTYSDRLFKIVAFSHDGMTIAEKEDLKRRIAQVLDSTKHKSKKLTIQSRGISFDARYENEATVSDGPSFVKMDVDFRVGPYGRSLFPVELYGSGLIDNSEGAAPLRVKHIITGPVTNPSFRIGGTQYTWRGTVPSGSKLFIDHDNYTCYTIDNYSNKKNVLKDLVGEFMSIPAGGSEVLVASSNTESRIITEYSTPLLW